MEEITLNDINILDIGNEIQLGGTIWTGKGQAFITLVPDKKEDLSNLKILPMSLEDWERFLRQTDLLETEILEQDPSGKIVKAIYRKSQRQIDAFLQWKIFQNDNYHCRYCGRTGIPLTVDHVVLWEEGGPTIELNLLSACKQCNKDRGRMQYEDWLNSDVYKRKSQNLPDDIKQANLNKCNDIAQIKTMLVKNIRSR